MKIDLFVRAVRERKKIIKIKNEGQQRYISRICGGGTPKNGELKLGTFVELMDIINHTSFYLFLMNSFRASGGQKLRFAFERHMALTTLPCASALACDMLRYKYFYLS
jgi:hypothetical protein